MGLVEPLVRCNPFRRDRTGWVKSVRGSYQWQSDRLLDVELLSVQKQATTHSKSLSLCNWPHGDPLTQLTRPLPPFTPHSSPIAPHSCSAQHSHVHTSMPCPHPSLDCPLFNTLPVLLPFVPLTPIRLRGPTPTALWRCPTPPRPPRRHGRCCMCKARQDCVSKPAGSFLPP
jgi:hypothetical protein